MYHENRFLGTFFDLISATMFIIFICNVQVLLAAVLSSAIAFEVTSNWTISIAFSSRMNKFIHRSIKIVKNVSPFLSTFSLEEAILMDLWIKSFILDKKAIKLIKLIQLNVTSNAITDDKTAESNLKHYSNENNICGVHHGDGSGLSKSHWRTHNVRMTAQFWTLLMKCEYLCFLTEANKRRKGHYLAVGW